MAEPDEGVGDRGAVFAWVELVCEGVEGQWVVAEEGDVENGFRIG